MLGIHSLIPVCSRMVEVGDDGLTYTRFSLYTRAVPFPNGGVENGVAVAARCLFVVIIHLIWDLLFGVNVGFGSWNIVATYMYM